MDHGIRRQKPVARLQHQIRPQHLEFGVKPPRQRCVQDRRHALERRLRSLFHGGATLIVATMRRIGDDDARQQLGRAHAERLRGHATHGAAHHDGGRLADRANKFGHIIGQVIMPEAFAGHVAVPMAPRIGRDEAEFVFKLRDDRIPEGAAQAHRMQKHDGAALPARAIGDRQA